MRQVAHNSKLWLALGIAILVLLTAPAGVSQPARSASLEVVITGVLPAKGPVRVGLWRTADGFLKGRSYRRAAADPVADSVRVEFDSLAPGRYAVSAYQDKNANGKLDQGFMGKPKEPYGFSNDARGRLGPPSFEDAAVEVAADSVSIRFRIR